MIEILSKLTINRVNYEKNKTGPFFMKHHVYEFRHDLVNHDLLLSPPRLT